MIRSSQIRKGKTVRACAARGFTLIELMVVIGIASLLAAMAVPMIWNTLRVYKMRSATSSISSAISSTRYQAIFTGCKTQIAFSKASYTYQVSSEAPALTGSACLVAFAATTPKLPLMGNGVSIDQDVTLTFSPGGAVSSVPVQAPLITMTLTYAGFTSTVPTEKVQVSTYGNVTVTP